MNSIHIVAALVFVSCMSGCTTSSSPIRDASLNDADGATSGEDGSAEDSGHREDGGPDDSGANEGDAQTELGPRRCSVRMACGDPPPSREDCPEHLPPEGSECTTVPSNRACYYCTGDPSRWSSDLSRRTARCVEGEWDHDTILCS